MFATKIRIHDLTRTFTGEPIGFLTSEFVEPKPTLERHKGRQFSSATPGDRPKGFFAKATFLTTPAPDREPKEKVSAGFGVATVAHGEYSSTRNTNRRREEILREERLTRPSTARPSSAASSRTRARATAAATATATSAARPVTARGPERDAEWDEPRHRRSGRASHVDEEAATPRTIGCSTDARSTDAFGRPRVAMLELTNFDRFAGDMREAPSARRLLLERLKSGEPMRLGRVRPMSADIGGASRDARLRSSEHAVRNFAERMKSPMHVGDLLG